MYSHYYSSVPEKSPGIIVYWYVNNAKLCRRSKGLIVKNRKQHSEPNNMSHQNLLTTTLIPMSPPYRLRSRPYLSLEGDLEALFRVSRPTKSSRRLL